MEREKTKGRKKDGKVEISVRFVVGYFGLILNVQIGLFLLIYCLLVLRIKVFDIFLDFYFILSLFFIPLHICEFKLWTCNIYA